MNLLQTITSFFVNKSYYYIVILFLCYDVPFFPLRILCFPHYVELSLGFKLELIKKVFFQSTLCRMDKWNLLLITNVLLFDVISILIHHFVLLFNILSQIEKFYVKRKINTQSSCMIFFRILYRMDIYFKRLVIYQSGITMNIISSI